jgi:hypothetical protein
VRRRATFRGWALIVVALVSVGITPKLRGQEPTAPAEAETIEPERPAPPARDDFESDENKDGIPDGWYNSRGATIVAEGGIHGPHFLRFHESKPGRPARLSRAFGIDGRKTEAIIIGLWVRLDQTHSGERLGQNPGLMIDFLGEGLRTLRRGSMGDWGRSMGSHWNYVARRFAIPPGTRDAIMSIGLLGATGTLDVDGMTFELVPVNRVETTNLVSNGDFELGSPDPDGWTLRAGARRMQLGPQSTSVLELPRSGSQAMVGLAVPVEPFPQLEVAARVRCQGLRGAGGAVASLFFVDDFGRILPGLEHGIEAFRWSGSFDWQPVRTVVDTPPRAVRAVLQFGVLDSGGKVWIDDVEVTASPNAMAGSWAPYHAEDDTTGWPAYTPSTTILEGSALDASYLLDAPAGKHGFVTVKNGRLHFTKGGRARFFGVSLLAPTAFQDAVRADALADRLARSGINLVRLGDLDTPVGAGRSLLDDTRDDTKAFDPQALAKLDHLIAALKKRGIYIALELQGTRKFRTEDGLPEVEQLGLGGGPASILDPKIGQLARETAEALLAHVNPETGLALRDEPALAWITLASEISLFDLIDDPTVLPPHYAEELRSQAERGRGSGRRLWQLLGSEHWKALADALRRDHVKVPIAGVSHWRRETEFVAEQTTNGLDLIDDRLYFMPPPWLSPDRRSMLWALDGGLIALAAKKRKTDRPYVVGQWSSQTQGAWAFPHEAADALLGAHIAAAEDWDALVRRGIFVYPEAWGSNASGTGGHEDIYQIPEAINGIPQVFGLWPHASALFHRADLPGGAGGAQAHHAARARRGIAPVPGWEPGRGRLIVDTTHTQGLAGWTNGDPVHLDQIAIETPEPFAVIVASSVGPEPIARTKRLLVSVMARVEPTGLRWVDLTKRQVADPGVPPLVQEPVEAKVRWRRPSGTVKAFALDNNGARVASIPLKRLEDSVELTIDGLTSGIHWELVAE